MSRTPEELREALEERRRHALRDLEELAEQVDAGDIEDDSAAELEAGYRAELQAVEERLERLPAASSGRDRAAKPAASRRSTPRKAPKDEVPRSRSTTRTMLIAMGAVMVVLSVLIYVAAQGDDDDTAAGGSGTADTTDFTSTGDPITDLEALVAAHPESIDFRLQLAGAYFDRGIQQRNTGQDSSESLFAAVQHYAFVYEGEATNVERAHAASRLGFLAFETQQYGQSVALLEEAMALDPENVEPEWFLGLVLLEGQQDPAAAAPVFESVLARPDLPDWLRDAANEMLAAARSAAGGGG